MYNTTAIMNFISWMNWSLVTAFITMLIAALTLKVGIESNKSSDKTLELTKDLKKLNEKNIEITNDLKELYQKNLAILESTEKISKDNLDLTKNNLKKQEELKIKETLSNINTFYYFVKRVQNEILNSYQFFKSNDNINDIDITGFESIESIIEKPPLNSYHEDLMTIKSITSDLNHQSRFYSINLGFKQLYDGGESDEQKEKRKNADENYKKVYGITNNLLKKLEELKKNMN